MREALKHCASEPRVMTVPDSRSPEACAAVKDAINGSPVVEGDDKIAQLPTEPKNSSRIRKLTTHAQPRKN